MLSAPNRLRKKRDFDELFKNSKSSGTRNLVFKYKKTDDKEPIRIAFIVSNKTEKSAVKRNKVKRQLREIVRKLIEELPTGYDGALIVKKPLLPLDYKQKEAEVKKVLQRAGMLN